jgi:membrane-bound ClpP family serine protease
MARELSMLTAPALSVLFLLLGALGLLDEGLAGRWRNRRGTGSA